MRSEKLCSVLIWSFTTRPQAILRDCAKGVSDTLDNVGYVTTRSERDSGKTKDILG